MNEHTKSNFELDIVALDTIISTSFVHILIPDLKIHYNNYKEMSLINPSAHDDVLKFIKSGVILCLKDMSSKYLKFLKTQYFSESGLIRYISIQLYDMSQDYLKSQIEANTTD